jgi:proteasome lid subunit RPN8/RPN11
VALNVRKDELAKLWAHARAGYPYEVVGILAGQRASETVVRVVPLENERADSPQNRYHVSAMVLYKAEQKLEAEGLEVVGYYHSHPDHPARYSDFDREHALPNMAYVITAVHGGEVVETRCWRLTEDREAMTETALFSQD